MYECPRCNYKTELKASYKNHLFREKLCLPEKNDISLEDEKNKINHKVANYRCDKCNKAYASRSGFHLHKKECTKTNDDITSCNSAVKSHIQSIMMNSFMPYGCSYMCYPPLMPQQQQAMPIMQVPFPTPTPVLTPAPASDPTSVPVHVPAPKKNNLKESFTYDFGNVRKMGMEDVSSLLHNRNFFEDCFKRGQDGLVDIIKMIWFNSDISCNKNVLFMDEHSVTYMSVYGVVTTKWHIYLKDLINTVDSILEQILASNKCLKKTINDFVEQVAQPLGCNFYSEIFNTIEDERCQKEIFNYLKARLLELKA